MKKQELFKMKEGKSCVHSVVYEPAGDKGKAICSSVYINKSVLPEPYPAAITITIDTDVQARP
jgi:hypothetical protein